MVMFSSVLVGLFVCEQDYGKTAALIFTKFGKKVARGAREERLDVDDK